MLGAVTLAEKGSKLENFEGGLFEDPPSSSEANRVSNFRAFGSKTENFDKVGTASEKMKSTSEKSGSEKAVRSSNLSWSSEQTSFSSFTLDDAELWEEHPHLNISTRDIEEQVSKIELFSFVRKTQHEGVESQNSLNLSLIQWRKMQQECDYFVIWRLLEAVEKEESEDHEQRQQMNFGNSFRNPNFSKKRSTFHECLSRLFQNPHSIILAQKLIRTLKSDAHTRLFIENVSRAGLVSCPDTCRFSLREPFVYVTEQKYVWMLFRNNRVFPNEMLRRSLLRIEELLDTNFKACAV